MKTHKNLSNWGRGCCRGKICLLSNKRLLCTLKKVPSRKREVCGPSEKIELFICELWSIIGELDVCFFFDNMRYSHIKNKWGHLLFTLKKKTVIFRIFYSFLTKQRLSIFFILEFHFEREYLLLLGMFEVHIRNTKKKKRK